MGPYPHLIRLAIIGVLSLVAGAILGWYVGGLIVQVIQQIFA